MTIDDASWLDPTLFSVGFCLALVGITLTQHLRNGHGAENSAELKTLPHPTIFSIVRKVTSFAIVLGAVLGFWIVGWWWIAIGASLALFGAFIVNLIAAWIRGSTPAYAFCLAGVLLMAWAQSPILRHWGLLP